MNKTTIIILSILVILVIGAGGFALTRSKKGAVSDGVQKADTLMEEDKGTNGANADAGESFTGSLVDLLRLGKNYTCDFDYIDESDSYSGKVYVASSGDRMYGEFTGTIEGTKVTSYVIRDGTYNYIWSSDSTQGLKAEIPEDEVGASFFESKDGDDDSSMSLANEDDVNYDCKPWIVKSSMFKLPANIDFVDLGAMMEGAMPGSDTDANGGFGVDCSACDSVPAGDARDQCLAALGC